jgi:hypothetical protein
MKENDWIKLDYNNKISHCTCSSLRADRIKDIDPDRIKDIDPDRIKDIDLLKNIKNRYFPNM